MYNAATQETNMHADATLVKRGAYLCEPVLWCHWQHHGDFVVDVTTGILGLNIEKFCHLLQCYPGISQWAGEHALRFVTCLNYTSPCDLFDTDACMQMAM